MTDRLSFVYDPAGSATEPVAVRQYGRLLIRVSVDDAQRMRRQLNGVFCTMTGEHDLATIGVLGNDRYEKRCIDCGAEYIEEPDGTVVPVAEAGAS